MKARLINLFDTFRASFWFLPFVMSIFAILFALAMGWVDRTYNDQIEHIAPWLETTPDAARSALSAVASAMVTLAGVVFSITMVTVSMASSQYGSRLLRCFMTDSLADFVIGSFVGVGLFCLITLRTIGDQNDPFSPHISTAIGMVMGLSNVVFLIYFVHNVAVSIQAPKIVEALASDLNEAVDRLYPDPLKDDPLKDEGEGDSRSKDVARRDSADEASSELPELPEPQSSHSICCSEEGYIQGIDYDTLATAAREADGIVYLNCKPGEFVVEQQAIARVDARSELDDEQLNSVRRWVQSALVVGARRTPRQDICCSILELVDVAVRALSPGVNDPFTAMNCIDRLGGGLSKLMRRVQPDPRVCDEDGRPLVVASVMPASEVIHDAFGQIRQYGASSVAVSIRMVETLTTVLRAAVREADVLAAAQQAEAVRLEFLRSDPQQLDIREFEDRFAVLVEVVGDRVDPQTWRSGRQTA